MNRCSKCGYPNSNYEHRCYSCGHLLKPLHFGFKDYALAIIGLPFWISGFEYFSIPPDSSASVAVCTTFLIYVVLIAMTPIASHIFGTKKDRNEKDYVESVHGLYHVYVFCFIIIYCVVDILIIKSGFGLRDFISCVFIAIVLSIIPACIGALFSD